jgi:hypothetical protein
MTSIISSLDARSSEVPILLEWRSKVEVGHSMDNTVLRVKFSYGIKR